MHRVGSKFVKGKNKRTEITANKTDAAMNLDGQIKIGCFTDELKIEE